MARGLKNPTVRRKVDVALSNAQQALSELLVYGSNSADRNLANDAFAQLETLRRRLMGMG